MNSVSSRLSGIVILILCLSAFNRQLQEPRVWQRTTRPEPKVSKLPAEISKPSASDVLRDGGQLNLNHATQEELTLLPGIGPALAKRIAERRPFASPSALVEVSGIGPKTLAKLLPFIEAGQHFSP